MNHSPPSLLTHIYSKPFSELGQHSNQLFASSNNETDLGLMRSLLLSGQLSLGCISSSNTFLDGVGTVMCLVTGSFLDSSI